MSSEDIKNRKWTDQEKQALRLVSRGQTLKNHTKLDFSDIPQLTRQQLAGMVRLREVKRKVPVSVRLDPEVLKWLKSKGTGHLTRINDILLNLMEAERQPS